MNERPPFFPSTVNDEDVAWACAVLNLPKSAFSGSDGGDPRLAILRSNENLDVEACPGSGKTTLLVAKLAILARRWTERCRGICVLSHTNVARREIEGRLGGTVEGRRLLSYPHFVGTIHNFVNEFLAIPWLRSKPFPIKMIDDDICQAQRWQKLPFRTRRALEANKHDHTLMKIAGVDFGIGDVRWGKGRTLGNTTQTYQDIQAACRTTSEEGFFCYDEMFLWARELLDQVPDVWKALRERFPILFIDEVQDNNELQSKLLSYLFIGGDKPVIRQRFGDANQAIYQHAGQTEGATTDRFPDVRIRRDIPNSHRFGREIGMLADPLALEPQGLTGSGPPSEPITSNTEGKHAIFLFADHTIRKVLATYAQYLVELFSEQELRAGVFSAVGGVHRPGRDDKPPGSVGQYWPDYDHELAVAEPKPKTFIQYVMAGRKLSGNTQETHLAVGKIAEGILRLAELANPFIEIDNRKRKHRYVLDLLADRAELRASYIDFVKALAVDGCILTAGEWDNKWLAVATSIAEAIAGKPATSSEARAFLQWRPVSEGVQPEEQARERDNFFRYPDSRPKVQIRLGSIHSVKGETHTATLVLDTFYYEHNLAALKDWLLGAETGKGLEGKRNLSRLKQHYVAMTRPSHLLCLAMREDEFSGAEIGKLKERSWRVARVTDAEPVWF